MISTEPPAFSNFSDLPAADVMRSIRLFGEKVIPALRGYEPF